VLIEGEEATDDSGGACKDSTTPKRTTGREREREREGERERD